MCKNNRHAERIVYITSNPYLTVYLIFLNVNYIFTASIISSILLLTAVIVYAFVKELRTVSGKCTILFLLALLVVQVTTALTHLGVYVLRSSDILNAIGGVGFLFSFFWMHVLSFDVFWTFKWVENKPSILLKLFFAWCVFFFVSSRHFRRESENRQLKFYCFYVFALASLILLTTAAEFFSLKFGPKFMNFVYSMYFIGFLMIAVVDVLFLLLTAVKIFKLSKVSSSSESSRFTTEKDR